MKIKMLLSLKKNRGFVTIPDDKTLREAAELMCAHGVGALLAVEPDDPKKHTGIVSERDVLKCVCTDLDFRAVKVADVMTRDVLVASPEDDLEYVSRIMKARHVRHIPVVEDGKITGVVSIRDIVGAMLEEQSVKVRHLSDYTLSSSQNDVF